ncbi:MAG: hypothetical protein KKF41_05605 [Actinobacteria bacterium]|nr:hypothetical protein [Actinomycetota bacterium]MBU1942473.1 hypothetical protein [Actinomycetota bacterium]MBU2687042.1 hypothetical protein [Actinomycetota bacterium]
MEKDEKAIGGKGDAGHDWVEIFAAILLAIATVATAWCAYQSARWSGVMTINFSAANAARVEATNQANLAFTEVSYDAAVLLDYAQAYVQGNTAEVEVLLQRFTRPELKAAMEAWLALDPANNPDAPRTPINMPQYKLDSLEESEALMKKAEKLTNTAKEDNQRSDNYVLLAVIFASVLFFAGISTKFAVRWLKTSMVIAGAVVFITTVVILAFQPIH